MAGNGANQSVDSRFQGNKLPLHRSAWLQLQFSDLALNFHAGHVQLAGPDGIGKILGAEIVLQLAGVAQAETVEAAVAKRQFLGTNTN
jgi:hypothetical protein